MVWVPIKFIYTLVTTKDKSVFFLNDSFVKEITMYTHWATYDKNFV